MNEPKPKLGPVRVTARAAEVYAQYASISIDDAIGDLERMLPEAYETSDDGRYRYRRNRDRLDITARVANGVVTSISVRGYQSPKSSGQVRAREEALGIVRRPRRGNPPDSKWYSTPRDERHRRGIELTISDEARERLDVLADERGESKSAVVEELILRAPRSHEDLAGDVAANEPTTEPATSPHTPAPRHRQRSGT